LGLKMRLVVKALNIVIMNVNCIMVWLYLLNCVLQGKICCRVCYSAEPDKGLDSRAIKIFTALYSNIKKDACPTF